MAIENSTGESQNQSPPEPADKKNYALQKGELEKLMNLLKQLDGYKKVTIREPAIDETEDPAQLVISLDNPETESIQSLKLRYNLKRISVTDAVSERGYLKQEYEYEHELGQHWDNLRWNVSKFFLGVQTIFSIAALQGLLELGKGNVENGKDVVDPALIVWGLIVLAVFNIGICIIWCVRNLGIHSWHVAAIRRQRLIELDPRWKHIPWFNSGVLNIMRNCEGFVGHVHKTGWLECWGPPAAFCLLWIGIVTVAITFLWGWEIDLWECF